MPRVQPGPRKGRSTHKSTIPPGTWQSRQRLWIDISGRGSLGPGKLRLLGAIAAGHSLSAAAKELGMSYRLAWQHLRLIEERTGITVVEPRRGGPHGGGTEPTPDGLALIEAYQKFHAEVEQYVQASFNRHFARWCSRPKNRPQNESGG